MCRQPATLTFNVSGTADFVTNTSTVHYAIVGGPAGGDTLRGHGTPGTGGNYDGSVNCNGRAVAALNTRPVTAAAAAVTGCRPAGGAPWLSFETE